MALGGAVAIDLSGRCIIETPCALDFFASKTSGVQEMWVLGFAALLPGCYRYELQHALELERL